MKLYEIYECLPKGCLYFISIQTQMTWMFSKKSDIPFRFHEYEIVKVRKSEEDKNKKLYFVNLMSSDIIHDGTIIWFDDNGTIPNANALRILSEIQKKNDKNEVARILIKNIYQKILKCQILKENEVIDIALRNNLNIY